jgi:TP901 family phage tail tape measure protein
MTTPFKKLRVDIIGDDTQISTVLGRVGRKFRMVGQQMSAAGSMLSMRITLPTVLAAGAITKLGVTYDDTMTQVETLTEAAGQQVAVWRQELLRLGPAVGRGPTELARALLRVTSAGLTTAAAMDVVRLSAKASAVGLGETGEVASAVTSAMLAYAKTGLTAAEATDQLLEAVKQGKAEASELAPVLGRVIPIASQLGVSFAQVGGFVASFTRLGVDAEEAVTALRGTLGLLFKQSKEGVDALKAVGLTLDDVRRSVRERGLAQTLVDLIGKFDGNLDAIAAFIPNVRALAGVLATASAQGDEFVDMTSKIEHSTGALSTAFERAAASPGFKFRQLLAQLQVAGLQLATQIMPVMLKVASVVSVLATRFTNLNPAVQKLVLIGIALAAALGPVLVILGGVVSGIGMVISAVGLTITGITLLGKAIVGLSVFAASLSLPVWTAIAAIAALGTWAFLLISDWDVAKLRFVLLWTEMKAAVADSVEFILRWLAKIPKGMPGMLGAMGNAARMAGNDINAALQGWVAESAATIERLEREINANAGQKGPWQKLKDTVRNLRQSIGAFLRGILEDSRTQFAALRAEAKETKATLADLTKAQPGKPGLAGLGLGAFGGDLKKAGVELGRDLWRGFIDGSLSMMASVRRIIAQIAEDAITGELKKLLKIASPSQVMRDLGLQTSAGFVMGLERGMVPVAPTLGRFVAADASAAPSTMRAGAGVGGAVTVHQTNRFEVQAIDSRDVERMLREQRGTISSIMADNVRSSVAAARAVRR